MLLPVLLTLLLNSWTIAERTDIVDLSGYYSTGGPILKLAGDAVVLDCRELSVNDSLVEQYLWLKDSNDVSELVPAPDIVGAQLIINPITASHSGNYSCLLTDNSTDLSSSDNEEDAIIFMLVVMGEFNPSIIFTQIKSTSVFVHISFVLPVSEDEFKFYLEYKSTGLEDWNRLEFDTSHSKIEEEIVVNDLDPITEYEVRLVIVSSVSGRNLTSSVKTFSTTSKELDDAPLIVNATAVNSTAIYIKWEFLDPSYNVTHFVVRRTRTTHNGKIHNDTTMVDPIVMSHLFGSLKPYTNYSVSVAAVNKHGMGPFSASYTVTTIGDVPNATVNISIKGSPGVQMVTLQLELRHAGQLHGPLLGYSVTYTELRGNTSVSVNTYNTTDNKHEQETSIANLTPYTNYTFSVRVVTPFGFGPASNITVATIEGVAEKVTNLNAMVMGQKDIYVTWDAPNNFNGRLLHYVIEVGGNNFEVIDQTSFTVSDNTDYHTQYDITVYAVTGGGPGAKESVTITTEQGVPEVPPGDFAVSPISMHKIELSWSTPSDDQLNGILQKYVVELRRSGDTDLIDCGSDCDDIGQEKTSTQIGSLSPYTEYEVRIAAFTVEQGSFTEWTIVRTNEGTPSAPRNLQVTTVLPTSISITWDPPLPANGIITQYIVYCNELSELSPPTTMLERSYTCRGLTAGQSHVLYVVGATGAGRGLSANVVVETPCELPAIQVDATSADSVRLSLESSCSTRKDFSYIVVVQQLPSTTDLSGLTLDQLIQSTGIAADLKSSSNERERRQTPNNAAPLPPYIAANISSSRGDEFVLGDGNQYGGFTNYPLDERSSYNVMIGMSLDLSSVPHYSTNSVVSIETTTEESDSESDQLLLYIVIAAVVGAVIVILFVVLLFVCCVHKRTVGDITSKEVEADLGAFERSGSLRSSINSLQLDKNGSLRGSKKRKMVDPVDQRRSIIILPELESHPPIPVEGFLHKLSVLEECERQLFIEEFASLQDGGAEMPSEIARLECNFAKNRYNNILPYDHSRVKLTPVKNVPGSDYINASYCDGYMKHRGYISTQGPLPGTFPDFWRMIWEQRTAVIVMLTRLDEGTTNKCHCYWPQPGESATTFGGIVQVKLLDCTQYADYIIRTFQIAKLGALHETRTVTQFHFLSWPDHGVPAVTTTMLMFVRRVQTHTASLHDDVGPTVVHCSAGVGRSGCYIVIDCGLQKLRDGCSTIDIYGHVNLLRTQRPYMVQHEEQYFFVYEAMAEALVCGGTQCSVELLPDHVEQLNQVNEGSSLIEKEFKKLALEKVDPQQFVSAKRTVNKEKNRYVNILPHENSRVHLIPIPGEAGSDYINGSYINGYYSKNLFIATQSPLTNTVNDFWRMVWETKSPIIVMVTDRSTDRYWPVDRARCYGNLSVELTTERQSSEYKYREFRVSVPYKDEFHIMRHFQFLDWPEVGVPSSGLPLIELINEVNKMYLSLNTTAPITVHCKGGVAATGVFIALQVLLDQLKIEQMVDVFQAVKVLRIQRPAMVQTMEQYRFIYDALVEHSGSESNRRSLGPSPPPLSHSKLPYYSSASELHSTATFGRNETAPQHSEV